MLFHYFGPDLLFLVIIQNGTEIHITKIFICNFKLTWLETKLFGCKESDFYIRTFSKKKINGVQNNFSEIVCI